MRKYLMGIVALIIIEGCSLISGQSPNVQKNVNLSGMSEEKASTIKEALWGWNKGVDKKYFNVNGRGLYFEFENENAPYLNGLRRMAQYESWDGREKIVVFGEYNNDDLKALMYHELGHAIGLDHNDSVESLMYPNFDVYYRPTPSPEDFENAKRLIK